MAITNLNNDHFEQSQMEKAHELLDQLMAILTTKTRNLLPEERQQYGSIREQNKLITLKVLELADSQPNLRSPDVDYKELRSDWTDSSFLRTMIAKMQDGIRVADNIRITHDWDAHQMSKQDYRHAEYKTITDGGAEFENKYNILKEFFTTNPDGAAGKADTPAVGQ